MFHAYPSNVGGRRCFFHVEQEECSIKASAAPVHAPPTNVLGADRFTAAAVRAAIVAEARESK